MQNTKHQVAQHLLRPEDARLTTGGGQYVSNLSAVSVAVFVRSSHAHADMTVDTHAAQQINGVLGVFTAADCSTLTLPTPNDLNGDITLNLLPQPCVLANGVVTSVGQPMVIVVANTLAAAQAAADAVVIHYTVKPLGSSVRVASIQYVSPAPFQPNVANPNVANPTAADITVTITHKQPRVVALAMEPRGVVARWANKTLTVHLPTQTPSRARSNIATALGLAESQVRVITGDVGGAFGAKSSLHPEDLAVCWAAQRLQTAVQWHASRSDDMQAGTHGRGNTMTGSLSVDSVGKIQHLQARFEFELGAWLPYSAAIPARNAARITPGGYVQPSVDIIANATTNHAAAVNIYRGAGRPEAALFIERLIDAAAAKANIDPLALRLANMVPAAAMPYATATGEVLDSGDYPALLNRCAALFDYNAERALQAQRRQQDELVGIGVAFYTEPCGTGWESARVTLHADGTATVASGSSSQGQGHTTAFAAIAAPILGCEPHLITVLEGDTNTSPAGIGALASRSMAIGGNAVAQAATEVAARRAAGEALPITFDTRYTAAHEAWSYGCVMVRLTIDTDTGAPTIEKLVWVDDAGELISPALAKGQLMGGLAQGLGQALMERMVYDATGQLITGSLMDYAVPRATDMPAVTIESFHSTSNHKKLVQAKGVGEAGCIGVPAAILNAACDALREFQTSELSFPLTTERLWRAMRPLSIKD